MHPFTPPFHNTVPFNTLLPIRETLKTNTQSKDEKMKKLKKKRFGAYEQLGCHESSLILVHKMIRTGPKKRNTVIIQLLLLFP